MDISKETSVRENIQFLLHNEWGNNIQAYVDGYGRIYCFENGMSAEAPFKLELKPLKAIIEKIVKFAQEKQELLKEPSFSVPLSDLVGKFHIYQQLNTEQQKKIEAQGVKNLNIEPITMKLSTEEAIQMFDKEVEKLENILSSLFPQGKVHLVTKNLGERFKGELEIKDAVKAFHRFAKNCGDEKVQKKARFLAKKLIKLLNQLDKDLKDPKYLFYSSDTAQLFKQFYINALVRLIRASHFFPNSEKFEYLKRIHDIVACTSDLDKQQSKAKEGQAQSHFDELFKKKHNYHHLLNLLIRSHIDYPSLCSMQVDSPSEKSSIVVINDFKALEELIRELPGGDMKRVLLNRVKNIIIYILSNRKKEIRLFDEKIQSIMDLTSDGLISGFKDKLEIRDAITALDQFARTCINEKVKKNVNKVVEKLTNLLDELNGLQDSTRLFYSEETVQSLQQFYVQALVGLLHTERFLPWHKDESEKIGDIYVGLGQRGEILKLVDQGDLNELAKIDIKDLQELSDTLLERVITMEKKKEDPFVSNYLRRVRSILVYITDSREKKAAKSQEQLDFDALYKDKEHNFQPLLDILTKCSINYESLLKEKIVNLKSGNKTTVTIKDLIDLQELVDKKLKENIGRVILDRLQEAILVALKTQNFYIDPNRLMVANPALATGLSVGGIIPSHYSWYLHQAILLEKVLDPEIDEVTKKQLSLLILQGYSKAASIAFDPISGLQVTPLFSSPTRYHRSDEENEILKTLRDKFAKDMNWDANEFLILDSPLFDEVIRREMSGKYDLEPGKEERFSHIIDQLFEEAVKGTFPENLVMFDISSLVQNPEDVKKLTQYFEKTLLQKCTKFFEMYPKSNNEEIVNNLVSKIHLCAFTQHKQQHLLLLPRFDLPIFNAGDPLYPSLKEQHLTLWKTMNVTLGNAGFVLSPDKAKEALLTIENITTFFNDKSFYQAKLATKGKAIRSICDSFEDLMRAPIINKFQKLSQAEGAPPYLKILPGATIELLQGLLEVTKRAGGIEQIYKKKKIEELLQVSYFLISEALNGAILHKDNLAEFINQIEVIHQQIQNILEITQPYQEGDFAKHMMHKLSKAGIIPNELGHPKVHLKASAMHSLASVIGSCEAQKGSPLNIAVLKDSYYESCDLINKAKMHTISTLDGDLYNKDRKTAKLANAPIDLFVCEFHHNISATRKVYGAEAIKEQVKDMFRWNIAAERFTVVIDTTINLELDEDFRDFLADEQLGELIKSGRLNVVFLRSSQKFDMLGLDNYYGGITTTINQGQSYHAFNQRMNHPEDQLKGLSYQGLTHLQAFSGIFLDQYRQAVMDNTQKLYSKLPQEIIYNEKTENFMQISQIDDKNIMFLDIKFPGYPLLQNFFPTALKLYAAALKLPLTTRSSFGFINSNFTTVSVAGGGVKYRFNPGLESEAAIDLYADFFCKLQKEILIGVKKGKRLLTTKLKSAEAKLEKAKNMRARAINDEDKAKADDDVKLAELVVKYAQGISTDLSPIIDKAIEIHLKNRAEGW